MAGFLDWFRAFGASAWPAMTDYTSGGVVCTASGDLITQNFAWQAHDGSVASGNGWLHNATNTAWVRFVFPTSATASEATVTNAGCPFGMPYYGITSFSVFGRRVSDSAWVELGTYAGPRLELTGTTIALTAVLCDAWELRTVSGENGFGAYVGEFDLAF